MEAVGGGAKEEDVTEEVVVGTAAQLGRHGSKVSETGRLALRRNRTHDLPSLMFDSLWLRCANVHGRYPCLFFPACFEYVKVQARVHNRFVPVFNLNGKLHCLDAVCYHAGGPLTVGDIEEIDGKACVRCPWHNYCVTVETGEKLYQKLVRTEDGKMVPGGWDSVGKRQRTHRAFERNGEVLVVLDVEGDCESDKYAKDEACGRRLASSALGFGGGGGGRGGGGAGGRRLPPFGGLREKARATAGHLFGADGKMPFFGRQK